jgi:hypothetical protein
VRELAIFSVLAKSVGGRCSGCRGTGMPPHGEPHCRRLLKTSRRCQRLRAK